MVEMTADEYDAYRAEAQQIMRWKAQLSVILRPSGAAAS